MKKEAISVLLLFVGILTISIKYEHKKIKKGKTAPNRSVSASGLKPLGVPAG
jgi:hypothetical protein